MATTTRDVLRQRLGESTYVYHSGTATGGGTGTVVEATLPNLFGSDDDLEGMWVIVTSGNAAGNIRRISSYASSTGTITVQTAFPASVASSNTFEVHEVNPTDVHNALNRASELLFPDLYSPVVDESIIIDNLLSNSGFEDWTSGSPDSWSDKGSPSLTQNQSLVWRGSNSVQIVTVGDEVGVEQNIVAVSGIQIREMVGKTLHIRGQVFCEAANVARIRVSFDGTNFTNSDYHGGSDEWEELTIDVAVPADINELVISCEADTGTGFFDDVVAWIAPIYRYTLPSTILRGPDSVEIQESVSRPKGPFYAFRQGQAPLAGQAIRVRGRNRLSALSDDSSTIEVDGDRAEAVIQRAKWQLGTMMKNRTRDPFYDVWIADAQQWLDAHLPRLRMPVTSEWPNMGTWHIEENGTTREIVFDTWRG